MILRKVVFDTNVYVDWLNEKRHDGLVLAPGFVPTAGAFDDAGRALRQLRDRGVEVRRASLVNDVLIAQSARAIGTTLITRDRDYKKLKTVLDFSLQVIVD